MLGWILEQGIPGNSMDTTTMALPKFPMSLGTGTCPGHGKLGSLRDPSPFRLGISQFIPKKGQIRQIPVDPTDISMSWDSLDLQPPWQDSAHPDTQNPG